MNRFVTVSLLASLLALAAAVPAEAKRNCGTYRGAKIVTHGGVTCKKAKQVYKRYDTGGALPRPWFCSASAGICERSEAKYFTFRFN